MRFYPTTALGVGSGTYFTNITAGSEDVNITSDSSGLVDVGTDLSSDSDHAFDYDYAGTSRPSGDWDIGAHEYEAAAPAAVEYSKASPGAPWDVSAPTANPYSIIPP